MGNDNWIGGLGGLLGSAVMVGAGFAVIDQVRKMGGQHKMKRWRI